MSIALRFNSVPVTATTSLHLDSEKSSISIFLDTDEDLQRTIRFPAIRYVAEDADNLRRQYGLNIEDLYFYVGDAFQISVPIDLVFLNPSS